MFGMYKNMSFLVVLLVSQLLYVHMHRTKTNKKTTSNIGIAASGVAGATAIISAN